MNFLSWPYHPSKKLASEYRPFSPTLTSLAKVMEKCVSGFTSTLPLAGNSLYSRCASMGNTATRQHTTHRILFFIFALYETILQIYKLSVKNATFLI